MPQGKRDGDFQLNLGLKYDIPSINLALFASATDLLDTYKLSYTLDTPTLKQKVEKRRNPRIIYVGLNMSSGSLSLNLTFSISLLSSVSTVTDTKYSSPLYTPVKVISHVPEFSASIRADNGTDCKYSPKSGPVAH